MIYGKEFYRKLHDLFLYDEEKGHLTVKQSIRGRRKKIGRVGCKWQNGYLVTMVDGKSHGVHRIIWFMKTGKWPTQIDHINRDKMDNKFSNLREVTSTENNRNMPILKRNKTGVSGIRWKKTHNCWEARINDNEGKTRWIYHGKDFFEACCRRKSAEVKFNYHENHGR